MICNLPCQRYPTKQEIPDVRDAYACEQDLAKRRETRLKYPGACSIEYQNAISIFTECLLRWDPITPDDECSFRVRLYADPDVEVSECYIITMDVV